MSIVSDERFHGIKTNGTIHDHLALVAEEMKKTEYSFTDRGYEFRWERVNTWYESQVGLYFESRLYYSVGLLPQETLPNKDGSNLAEEGE